MDNITYQVTHVVDGVVWKGFADSPFAAAIKAGFVYHDYKWKQAAASPEELLLGALHKASELDVREYPLLVQQIGGGGEILNTVVLTENDLNRGEEIYYYPVLL